MHLQSLATRMRTRLALNIFFAFALLLALIAGYSISQTLARSAVPGSTSVNQVFRQASQTYGVPADLLKAICYIEGRMSTNDGIASPDNGFGCMHLVKNYSIDTLDKAAKETGASVTQLKQNLPANILGGAAILRDDALQVSSTHSLPAKLADWYGAVALYSDAPNHSVALIYANSVYKLLNQGFRITTASGEVVTLAPQAVQPTTTTASVAMLRTSAASLPGGCVNDGNVDYPGAIDCILKPVSLYDCNSPTSPSNCNYTSSDRPTSCTIDYPSVVVTQPCNIDEIVIHDTEGSLTSALNEFMCLGSSNPPPSSCVQSSVQYIIDTDGTVYQVLHEQDIAYHAGNFWENMHSIGIEHVGYDATGYQWYNAAQYLASARLVAYLIKKYHLTLDRNDIVAHGTVPSSTLAAAPNHLDPGPYWFWDYYFNLISQQGVPLNTSTPLHTITLHPKTDQTLPETSSDYNFFDLYKGPSTTSGIIPTPDSSAIYTGYNVEPGMTYYYVAKQPDAAGTGDTMYEIWYGEEDQAPSSFFADAKLAWLAVPPGDGVEGGQGQKPGVFSIPPFVQVTANTGSIYGRPTSNSQYVIGEAPTGAIFYSGYSLVEDGTNNLWYEINFNHRQAWIPASEITHFHW